MVFNHTPKLYWSLNSHRILPKESNKRQLSYSRAHSYLLPRKEGEMREEETGKGRREGKREEREGN